MMQILDTHPAGCKQRGIRFNDKFGFHPTDTGHFRDAWDITQPRRDQLVLNGTQLREVETAAFDGVPVDLPGGDSFRSQLRNRLPRNIQFLSRKEFPDTLPRDGESDVVIEDQMQQ